MTPSEVLALNVVNAALGVATVICIVAIAWGVYSEVVERLRARSTAADMHAFALPELGLTMADGGEKVDEKKGEKDGR